MGVSNWPSSSEVENVRRSAIELCNALRDVEVTEDQVRVVASPYRICPLGAHIDHQGGTVTAMTINKGILLGFIPSGDTKIILRSAQFDGDVQFSIEDTICKGTQSNGNKEYSWGRYARGAAFALQKYGKSLHQGVIGYVEGSGSFDSSGISSSAAVGVAYLLALERANNIVLSESENIELDRLIENEYLGLNNGILDQSAILLSQHNCLTCIDCKSKEYKLVHYPKLKDSLPHQKSKEYKILLAFSGLKQNLTTSSGYNFRVAECKEAAKFLIDDSHCCAIAQKPNCRNFRCFVFQMRKGEISAQLRHAISHFFIFGIAAHCGIFVQGCTISWGIHQAPHTTMRQSGKTTAEARLCNVSEEDYNLWKGKLEGVLFRRAEHYFSENRRVIAGVEAWSKGDLKEFGKLMSESGLSSIQNYECGCEPLIQLYHILVKAPGVYGARFCGAGFRGCCVALVDPKLTDKAASFVQEEYKKVQPELFTQLKHDNAILICETGDKAFII